MKIPTNYTLAVNCNIKIRHKTQVNFNWNKDGKEAMSSLRLKPATLHSTSETWCHAWQAMLLDFVLAALQIMSKICLFVFKLR